MKEKQALTLLPTCCLSFLKFPFQLFFALNIAHKRHINKQSKTMKKSFYLQEANLE